MKGSVIAVGFFLLGLACGRMGWLPSVIVQGNGGTVVLCLLMFTIAYGMGREPSSLVRVVKGRPLFVLLPFATIVGTLAGSTLVALLLPGRTLEEWNAVGSGMAYYSLSSVLITEYRGPELGTLALLTNISRELLALLAAPLWAACFGRLAPIAVAGATSMDTALPVCVRYAGKEYASLSLYHGFVADTSVFFLITLFVG